MGNTAMQQRLQKVALATGPRCTLSFIPLSAVAGYSSEEMYSLSANKLARCVRRCCGRDTDDRTLISVKFLTRHGAHRNFQEGGAVSELRYLEPGEKFKDNKVTTVNSAFYAPLFQQLRAWGSALKLFMAEGDSQAVHIVPTAQGPTHGWQPAVVRSKDARTSDLSLHSLSEKRSAHLRLVVILKALRMLSHGHQGLQDPFMSSTDLLRACMKKNWQAKGFTKKSGKDGKMCATVYQKLIIKSCKICSQTCYRI